MDGDSCLENQAFQMTTKGLNEAVARQLGAFANVDETDSDDFIARLDQMQALDAFRAYKRITFDLMRLAAGMKAADVGCGTGEDARALADITGVGGEVIGIDLSEAMIAQAYARHPNVPGLRFACAPSDSLGLPDDCLDGIRADRVLIHVPDPVATLDEMIRVTRSGGRIVVSEPDMPGFWVASDDYATTELVVKAIANSCVTPFLPRDLWAIFCDRGLIDISFSVQPITSFDLSVATKVLDFSAVLTLMVHKGLLDHARAMAWSNDLQARGRSGRFVGGMNIMVVSATKF
jgi:ubiquinone/menaquinone biosynthesis C-methylase UbiE